MKKCNHCEQTEQEMTERNSTRIMCVCKRCGTIQSRKDKICKNCTDILVPKNCSCLEQVDCEVNNE